MIEYRVNFSLKRLANDSPPWPGFSLHVSANNLEEAALEAVPRLIKVGINSILSEVWDAYVLDSRKKNQPYEILKDGDWLIDFKTGKPKNSSLEEKV